MLPRGDYYQFGDLNTRLVPNQSVAAYGGDVTAPADPTICTFDGTVVAPKERGYVSWEQTGLVFTVGRA